MKLIQFIGACGVVTGSGSLLTGDNGDQLIIDFGMYQDANELSALNYEKFSFGDKKVIGILLTHAHLDHCGRLPLIIKGGYSGKIYMTRATRMLAALVLYDAAKIAAEDSEKKVLFTTDDVDEVFKLIEEVEYDKEIRVGDFTVVFRDAGHILGSACIEVKDQSEKKIIFSGDLGNTPEDIIRPTEKIFNADEVVMEATYGNRLHKQEDPAEVLKEEINAIEKSKGVLIIPSFSIERAQELLHRINQLKMEDKIGKETRVFLDSPMAIRATEIFRDSSDLYNKKMINEIKKDDPFDFNGLTISESVEDSKAILLSPPPKVIISGSGMMHGGRVLHHAINYLSDTNTRLLLVGYQAPGTLGRQLLDGNTNVKIYNKEIIVGAHIREVEAMSCHADQKKLLRWLGQIKGVKRVFLVHAEEDARRMLAEKIRGELGIKEVILPKLGEVLNL